MHIRPLTLADLEAFRQFTDREIGEGYYAQPELHDLFERSQKNNVMCSFTLVDDHENFRGIRISYPPGNWERGKGMGLRPELWPHPMAKTAYFQSSFIAGDLQGQGWGIKLAEHSIKALRELNTEGIVCHSWKESPNNSSLRYLEKMGFMVVAEHPKYWKDIPYNCTKCLKPPCLCTAVEMYFDLEKNL